MCNLDDLIERFHNDPAEEIERIWEKLQLIEFRLESLEKEIDSLIVLLKTRCQPGKTP